MSVFQDYALTTSMILILFVIGWILHSMENLGHRKRRLSDGPKLQRVTPRILLRARFWRCEIKAKRAAVHGPSILPHICRAV